MITDITSVEMEARHLLHSLVETLPGRLGQVAHDVLCAELPTPETATLGADPLAWAPRILALCCEAYNQPIRMAIPVGASLELLGIVSSVLDAVQDGHWTVLNTYSPTLADPHTSASVKAAVITNVGMSFIGLAGEALLEHGPRYGIAPATLVSIGQVIVGRWATICAAQHADLTVGRTPITLAEYDRIVEGKAGAIGGVVCEAGAILAGAAEQRHLWRALGTARTVAHQLVDDYKDLATDLATGQQLSHPILYGLEVADPHQRQALLALLKRARSDEESSGANQDALDELTTILSDLGAKPYAESCILQQLQQARDAIIALAVPAQIHQELEQWVASVLPRNADLKE
jgi:geranylgeranyl pyrophosphate synthase